MKENFGELYSRLYRENYEELENMREKAKKQSVIMIILIVSIFVFAMLNPLFSILGIIGLIVYIAHSSKNDNNNPQNNYREVFKQKIIGPIIENFLEGAKYDSKAGLSAYEYRKAGYNETYDRYNSEDLIIAPLAVKGETTTYITVAEVHTERESRDKDGRTSYTTIFHGLAGSFLLSKNIGKSIYIRSNGRVSNWNKYKVKMDMTEFEKVFDVESDDAILTMRVLTSDVMTEMIDLYKKFKYRFEINILNDTIYMRIRTGGIFEPSVFKEAMEYSQIEKYYLVLKALTSIASHIYGTVSKLDI